MNMKIKSLTIILILFKFVNADGKKRLVVTGANESVYAHAGEDVTLSCSVNTHVNVTELQVEWRKTDDDIEVLRYYGKENKSESQDGRYSGRAEFFTEEIPKGNFSVKLRKVRTEDKGEFRCEVHSETDSANTTARIAALGYSSLHWWILGLCIAVILGVLLTGLLSVWYFIKESCPSALGDVYKKTKPKSESSLQQQQRTKLKENQQTCSECTEAIELKQPAHNPQSEGISKNGTLNDQGESRLALWRHRLLVIVLPIMVCIAFILWGVTEGSTEEAVICPAISLLSIFVLIAIDQSQFLKGISRIFGHFIYIIASIIFIIAVFTVPVIQNLTKPSIAADEKGTLGSVVGEVFGMVILMTSMQILLWWYYNSLSFTTMQERMRKILLFMCVFLTVVVLAGIGGIVFLAKYVSGRKETGEFFTIFMVLMTMNIIPVVGTDIFVIRYLKSNNTAEQVYLFGRFIGIFSSLNRMIKMQVINIYIQLIVFLQGALLLRYFIPIVVAYFGVCVCFIAKEFSRLSRHFYLAQKIFITLHLIFSFLYLTMTLENNEGRTVKICEFVFIYMLTVTNKDDWRQHQHLGTLRKYVYFSGVFGLPFLNSVALVVALKQKADTGKQPLVLRLIVLISGSVFLFSWFVIQMFEYYVVKKEKIIEVFTQMKDLESDEEQLKLLKHADECHWEKLVYREWWPCSRPYCRTMKKVLEHVKECETSCQEKHCASTCKYVSDWENKGYRWFFKIKLTGSVEQTDEKLKLLLHADHCQWLKKHFREWWSCSKPRCHTMSEVLEHMTHCRAGTSCQVEDCTSIQKIMSDLEKIGYKWICKGQLEGEAEGEKGQQASSSQREQGETEELQQMDREAEEDQVITEREAQTGQERENDEAAAATHSTTGFDLGDKDTGPRQPDNL